jgi:hypothetical protein
LLAREAGPRSEMGHGMAEQASAGGSSCAL